MTEAKAAVLNARKSRDGADRALIETRSETAALRDSDAYRAAGQLTDLVGPLYVRSPGEITPSDCRGGC